MEQSVLYHRRTYEFREFQKFCQWWWQTICSCEILKCRIKLFLKFYAGKRVFQQPRINFLVYIFLLFRLFRKKLEIVKFSYTMLMLFWKYGLRLYIKFKLLFEAEICLQKIVGLKVFKIFILLSLSGLVWFLNCINIFRKYYLAIIFSKLWSLKVTLSTWNSRYIKAWQFNSSEKSISEMSLLIYFKNSSIYVASLKHFRFPEVSHESAFPKTCQFCKIASTWNFLKFLLTIYSVIEALNGSDCRKWAQTKLVLLNRNNIITLKHCRCSLMVGFEGLKKFIYFMIIYTTLRSGIFLKQCNRI